jgi:hypothetical protein
MIEVKASFTRFYVKTHCKRKLFYQTLNKGTGGVVNILHVSKISKKQENNLQNVFQVFAKTVFLYSVFLHII